MNHELVLKLPPEMLPECEKCGKHDYCTVSRVGNDYAPMYLCGDHYLEWLELTVKWLGQEGVSGTTKKAEAIADMRKTLNDGPLPRTICFWSEKLDAWIGDLE